MLQSEDDTNYFTKNLYELDIEQKVLTVYDAGTEELIEQVYLEGRVRHVVTTLQSTLVDNSEEISDGLINPEKVSLPQTEAAPFAVVLDEECLMLFWP